jgi:UDP-N-acetylmuramoylalanine--D-glutamate ligase
VNASTLQGQGVESLRGKRALVMGFGRFGGGRGAAEFLLRHGAKVTVTDVSPKETLEDSIGLLAQADREAITWKLGCHEEADFTGADLVVANPAVPTGNALLVAARAAGVWVTTDIEIFLRLTPMRLALITGTQGKSSTAAILAGLLEMAQIEVHLGGNIGASLLSTLPSPGAVTPNEHQADTEAVAVLELSSYQLEGLAPDRALAKADVVCVTNLMEDHIARHGSLGEYHLTKAKISRLLAPNGQAFGRLEDIPYLVENGRESLDWVAFQFDGTEGDADYSEPSIDPSLRLDPARVLRVDGQDFLQGHTPIAPLEVFKFPGAFQRSNALAALGMALSLGVPMQKLGWGLSGLQGLPHRAQDLGTVGHAKIRVIDNAISTTPDSTRSVLRSLVGPVTLLVGGRSKGQDPSRMVAEAKRNTAKVLCFGEAAEELQAAFAGAGLDAYAFATMEEAVQRATTDLASPTLLFSPACSSFDAFSNFEQRAKAFRQALGLEP